MTHAARLGVALAAALAMGLPVSAQEQEADLLRAGALARSGRCDEALGLLASSGATSARASLLRGQCHVEGKRWAEAVAALDEAMRADPGLDDAKLPLVIARYHVGDLAGARQALDALPPSATERPEYHLYRGLLLLDTAAADAGASFDRARELAPTEMEPIASYYSGIAWLAAKDRARADASFDRVIALAPGTEWAEQAEIAKGRGPRGPLSRWAWVRAGAEWDSNVVLRGQGVALPSDISNEEDGRGVWVAHGGAELFRRGDWSGGVTGAYYGSAHFDLTDFDEHHPTAGTWLDYRIDESTVLRLRGDVGYAWIDGDDFLLDVDFGPTLYRDWGDAGRSEFGVHATHVDFKYSLSTPPAPFDANYRDRDGWGWAVTAQHAFRAGLQDTEFFFGASYLGFAADGGEYDYDGADAFAGVETLLPYELLLRGLVGASYVSFDDRSSYNDPPGSGGFEDDDRSDFAWRARLELERALGAGFSALARYAYLDRSSNVDVFDYDRHIVGVYVTYTFAP